MLGAGHSKADPRQSEGEPDATVSERIQQRFPSEQDCQEHPDWGGDEHVKRNGEVGRNRPDGGNQHCAG